MTANTRRRRGVTLMEVMIATAILTIGMVAIMALFPIGAVNFARALNQDRSATHAVNSEAMFAYYWKKAWDERKRNPLPLGSFGAPTGNLCATTEEAYMNSQEPMLLMLDFHPSYAPTGINLASSQPSFPVLVDPVGWHTRAGDPNNQGFIAGMPTLPVRTTLRRAITTAPDDSPNPATRFPRQAPYRPGMGPPASAWQYPFYPQSTVTPNPYNPNSYLAPYQTLDTRVNIRLTALLDDLTYDGSGEASAATGQLERAGRYSAAWLIQRNRNDVPTDLDVKVLVFAGRSVTDTPSAETPYSITNIIDGKTLELDLTGMTVPLVRRGGWIGFTMPAGSTSPVQSPYPIFDLYRVVGVNDQTPNRLIVELETPVRIPSVPAGPPIAVVFDNLFEVYDRGIITPMRTSTK